jgi:peptide/nickel transport system substrate-binding protein
VPGGLFYHQNVLGYRTYDTQKAKQIVSQLGGLTVELGTLSGYVSQQVMTALQTPAGVGVGFRFQSTSPFTGVSDPKLDDLLNQAAGSTDPVARDAAYSAASKLIIPVQQPPAHDSQHRHRGEAASIES